MYIQPHIPLLSKGVIDHKVWLFVTPFGWFLCRVEFFRPPGYYIHVNARTGMCHDELMPIVDFFSEDSNFFSEWSTDQDLADIGEFVPLDIRAIQIINFFGGRKQQKRCDFLSHLFLFSSRIWSYVSPWIIAISLFIICGLHVSSIVTSPSYY